MRVDHGERSSRGGLGHEAGYSDRRAAARSEAVDGLFAYREGIFGQQGHVCVGGVSAVVELVEVAESRFDGRAMAGGDLLQPDDVGAGALHQRDEVWQALRWVSKVETAWAARETGVATPPHLRVRPVS